jgi:hypothetical protein
VTASFTARRQLTFLGLALLVNAVASTVVAHVTDPARHRTVEFAAILDMTVTVTALYYWLVVRPGLRPKASLAFVALMGLLRASFAFPDAIPGRAVIAGAAELFIVGALLFGFRSAIPFDAAATAIAGELKVFYYAFAWRARPDVPPGAASFTLHRKSGFGDILFFVGLASLLEIVPVHLVAAHWSAKLAWLLTALSLYGATWAVALSRSLSLRPSLVSEHALTIRFGLLFSLVIPADAIARVSDAPIENATCVPRNAIPNLWLELHRPLEAQLLFGIKRRVTRLALAADDPELLRAALATHYGR